MRLVGLPLRDGEAEGPVAFGPEASGRSKGGRVIAALGEIPPTDPGLVGRAGWLGITTAVTLPKDRAPLGAGPPAVAEIDLDVLRGGETVRLDGGAGWVELPGVEEVEVVTSFLERPDGRILLLRRSDKVGSFRGRWAGVSGYLEDATPEAQARREIREETGIGTPGVRLVSAGRPVYARDSSTVFTVHPFRFQVGDVRVAIDWEHTEFEWVDPGEIDRRATVPKLDRVWRAVAPGPPSPPPAPPTESV
jgi:8-oxo-dGTP pyrophosphatase MutT (NUDIX family)